MTAGYFLQFLDAVRDCDWVEAQKVGLEIADYWERKGIYSSHLINTVKQAVNEATSYGTPIAKLPRAHDEDDPPETN